MHAAGQFFFIFVGMITVPVLVVWYLFSSLGRIIRATEDIALTLRRIEENRKTNGLS
jgi:hypothetical protein